MSENFTPEQDKELEERAEARDWARPRKSRFSTGEQGELDQTARELEAKHATLGFNPRQQRELTHLFRKRLLPIASYILLVVVLVVVLAHQQHEITHLQHLLAR